MGEVRIFQRSRDENEEGIDGVKLRSRTWDQKHTVDTGSPLGQGVRNWRLKRPRACERRWKYLSEGNDLSATENAAFSQPIKLGTRAKRLKKALNQHVFPP